MRRSIPALAILPVETINNRRGRPATRYDSMKSASLGDQHAVIPIRDFENDRIRRPVALNKIQCMNRVVTGLGKPRADAPGQLRVNQKLHAASEITRLMCARRAA